MEYSGSKGSLRAPLGLALAALLSCFVLQPGSVDAGGPGGDFDWHVRSGEIFFFDTTATTIVGGPGGVPTRQQETVNGIVDVRDFVIEAGGEVRVEGPHPLQINASRNVIIRGMLDLSGLHARNVTGCFFGASGPPFSGAGATVPVEPAEKRKIR